MKIADDVAAKALLIIRNMNAALRTLPDDQNLFEASRMVRHAAFQDVKEIGFSAMSWHPGRITLITEREDQLIFNTGGQPGFIVER